MSTKFITYLVIGILGVLLLASGLWFFFLRSTPAEQSTGIENVFGINPFQTAEVTPTGQSGESQTQTNITEPLAQNITKVAEGPVVSATVVQTLQPTTTIARYVQQNNGHVFDLVLDSSGAVPKAISNTTIPGVARALWAQGGAAAILQYLDGNITKTVSLTFPQQSGTTTRPVAIKFLPDGIRDIAVSPNGTRVVYLLRTASGADGYTAAVNGDESTKLFSIPLSEILISWPSTNTMLAYTKATLGTPGIAFSINVSTGAIVPLLYAPGLTLTADPSYSYLVYQTSGAAGPSTYVRTTADGTNAGLSFDPYPEKCVWATATTTLYCAAPLTYVAANYLDLWHAGTAAEAEALYAFTFPGGRSSIVAVPGGENGGVESTIDTLSLSPDQKYLLFVRRGDRSLWRVRLDQ